MYEGVENLVAAKATWKLVGPVQRMLTAASRDVERGYLFTRIQVRGAPGVKCDAVRSTYQIFPSSNSQAGLRATIEARNRARLCI